MSKNLVSLADDFMVSLLKDGMNSPDLWARIDISKNIGNYIAIKNKINPADTEGSKINEYRDTLSKERAGRSIGGNPRTKRASRNNTRDARIEAAESIKKAEEEKSRLDAASDSNVSSSGHDTGPTPSIVSFNGRSLHTGVTHSLGANMVENGSESNI